MTRVDARTRPDASDGASPGASTARNMSLERLRADLGALCLLAHEDAVDLLIDAYRLHRPTRAVIREAYCSLRRLRRAEANLTARFVECALDAGEPEALLHAYADAVAGLALHGDIRDALLGAMRGRLKAELTVCLRLWCETVRGRVRAVAARHASVEAGAGPVAGGTGQRQAAAYV